jgi:hypothetical protein
VILIFSFSACIRSTEIYIGGNPKVKKGGPPPHAPAYGYRAKYTYYYYPTAQVYFDITRKIYFYMDGTSWRMAVSLPTHLRVALADHVTIEMDSDKPYSKHEIHKKKYPPDQLKKKGKWKKK